MTKEESMTLRQRANQLLSDISKVEMDNASNIKVRQKLEEKINELTAKISDNNEALDIASHAIDILRQVSDESVKKAYKFLEDSLNPALEKMFEGTTRRIRIREYTRSGQYPQLRIELEVGNGITRSLKSDSGHGMAQIVSLLSILSLIVITGSRRILVMDEVISGLSVRNRKIVSDILWGFTEIGFQFIVNDHGFVPEGSHVYYVKMTNNVSHIEADYIAEKGVYLQGGNNGNYGYSKEENNHVGEVSETDETDDNSDDNSDDTLSMSNTVSEQAAVVPDTVGVTKVQGDMSTTSDIVTDSQLNGNDSVDPSIVCI